MVVSGNLVCTVNGALQIVGHVQQRLGEPGERERAFVFHVATRAHANVLHFGEVEQVLLIERLDFGVLLGQLCLQILTLGGRRRLRRRLSIGGRLLG
jgi:hypothetical protein